MGSEPWTTPVFGDWKSEGTDTTRDRERPGEYCILEVE